MGGVISGYWATGSTHTAMPPPSVMMIDSTEAKIGRWMKKRENMGARCSGVRCQVSGVRCQAVGSAMRLGYAILVHPTASSCSSMRSSSDASRQARLPGRRASLISIQSHPKHAPAMHDAATRSAPRASGTRGVAAQPIDDVEKDGREEDAEEGHAQHAAEDGRAQGPPHLGAGAAGDQQGQRRRG